MVGPKKAKLTQAEGELAEANRKLADKQAALAKVEKNVETLKEQLRTAQTEQKELNDEVWFQGLWDDYVNTGEDRD